VGGIKSAATKQSFNVEPVLKSAECNLAKYLPIFSKQQKL
jgi:hypothetical protein